MMNELEQLQKQSREFDSEIDALCQKRSAIKAQIRAIEREQAAKKLTDAHIAPESKFICFAKRPGYHYDMVRCLCILAVYGPYNISCLKYENRIDDNTLSVHISNATISLDYIMDMCEDYAIYLVDNQTFRSFFASMCVLMVDTDHVAEYMAEIAAKGTRLDR